MHPGMQTSKNNHPLLYIHLLSSIKSSIISKLHPRFGEFNIFHKCFWRFHPVFLKNSKCISSQLQNQVRNWRIFANLFFTAQAHLFLGVYPKTGYFASRYKHPLRLPLRLLLDSPWGLAETPESWLLTGNVLLRRSVLHYIVDLQYYKLHIHKLLCTEFSKKFTVQQLCNLKIILSVSEGESGWRLW
jgi:hypothetical protein